MGSATDSKTILLKWLNDTYAMEHSLGQVLENHIADAKDHPEMAEKLREHRELANSQAARVKACIERLGGEVSGLKTGMATVMGRVQGMATGIAAGADEHDELVKNALADYSAEHLEIAAYKALAAAAEALGDHQTANVCREIQAEEEEMAAWLDARIPGLVSHAVQSSAKARKAA